MNATKFHEALKNSNIKVPDVIKKLVETGMLTPKTYPNAFDEQGNLRLTYNTTKKVFHTYCPYHDKQNNGDAFAIYNDSNTVFCYSGACSAGKRPMNLIELVISLGFEQDPAIAVDRDLSGPFFRKAQRFLVEHFGKELGLKLDDIKFDGVFKTDKKQEVLKAAAEYYHFLGTKTNYGKKLDAYMVEHRHFKFSKVDFQILKARYMIGITPRSEENDKLYQYLSKKGFTDEEILEAKVCRKSEYDGKIRDFFRNHLVIPYIYKGKVIGLYGRNLDKNCEDKYRHLRLQGEVEIPNSLDDIFLFEEFFLVEGEIDKLAINAMDLRNAMEARGTKGFKRAHAEKIRQYRLTDPSKCKKAYMVFDPDGPGQDAVMNIAKMLVEIGIEVLVIALPTITKDDVDLQLDANDMLKEYQDQAAEEFLRLKERAISFDAFCLLYKLGKENVTTLSEARMAIKRVSEYLDVIPKLERVFILEEVLNNLSPSFLKVGLDKDLLRDYLKELWVHQEVKKPIEGLEKADTNKQPSWLVTRNEETYEKFNNKLSNILLVRNLSVFKEKLDGKTLLFDSSFEKDEIIEFTNYTKVYSGEFDVHGSGKVILDSIEKM
ncbi:toprim domain-containing protein [Bacillus toyonensis]|uniref:toprim domain-containing protein n=1 Tax=Bacillus toyonensis TaxID=155322 RepID=UPI002E2396E7|nr:toprim domain-containing protein [Bacillus toyonensis]